MMSMPSYSGKILFVDLSKKKVRKEALKPAFAKKYVGGKGFGAKFLLDHLNPKTNPLSPDNLLMYITGPLTATLAPCNRYCIVTKSPLTGAFNDAYAGGHFGQELKYAGYDVLIITGRSEKPCYIWIDDDSIEIRAAGHLWGFDTYETYDVIKSDLGDQSIKISCIGPAGENLVRFAMVDSDYHRQAGRCGAGAVMGSKNLKAIAIRGTGEISVANLETFLNAVQRAYDEINKSEGARNYRLYGTPGTVAFSNKEGFYPTRNFQEQIFEKADAFSPETQRKRLWLKNRACFACPVHCSKVGVIKRGRYAGNICDIIEYEIGGLLGGNCGVDNTEAVAYGALLCDKLGMDAVSTGNVIGFAMDCYQRGILTKEDTDGLELNFGNWKAQIEMIKKIAHRSGLGETLAEGVMRAAKKIRKGAEKYAVHIKGLETPAWPPRGSPAMGLALATADRGGCHQRAWPLTYEIAGKGLEGQPLKRLSTEGKAEVTLWEQYETAALYTLVICELTRYCGITPEIYVRLLSTATGWDVSKDDFMKYGERMWNLSRVFNVREGFTRKDDTLPPRFSEPLPSGPAKGHRFTDEDLNKMLDDYYRRAGWTEEGIPTRKKLVELELEEEAEALEVDKER